MCVCGCVWVGDTKHSLYGSMTGLTLVTLHHTPTLLHIHIDSAISLCLTHTLNQSVTHSGSSRRRACRLHVHTDMETESHTHTQLQCDWWLCDTHHRGSFSGPGRAAFVRGDLGEEKAENGIECRRRAIDGRLREEGICNCTALLIWAPQRSLMTESREAAHFISAKCILNERLNSTVTPAMMYLQMRDLWRRHNERNTKRKIKETNKDEVDT